MRALSLAISLSLICFSSFASDSDRITQLEKEVLELKLRLTNLEVPPVTTSTRQKPAASTESWKSLANWRSLKSGMSPDDVRAILGEPSRVEGGIVTYWTYPSRGEVTFVRDQVTRWAEPREDR